MLKFLRNSLIILMLLFSLNGCSNIDNSEIRITPYELSNDEKLLLEKTGIIDIAYFTIDGKLQENEDIHYEVEIYKDGRLTAEKVSSYGEVKRELNDDIISFGVNNLTSTTKGQEAILLAGQPDGLISTSKEHAMTGSTFSLLVDEEITLSKDSPVYLAAWGGTTKNHLEGMGVSGGKLPEQIQNQELAFVYKVTLVDK
jgi:hypothetical protein